MVSSKDFCVVDDYNKLFGSALLSILIPYRSPLVFLPHLIWGLPFYFAINAKDGSGLAIFSILSFLVIVGGSFARHNMSKSSRIEKYRRFRDCLFSDIGEYNYSFVSWEIPSGKPAGFVVRGSEKKIVLSIGDLKKSFSIDEIRSVNFNAPGRQEIVAFGLNAGVTAYNVRQATEARSGQTISFSMADIDNPQWVMWCGTEHWPKYQEVLTQFCGVKFS